REGDRLVARVGNPYSADQRFTLGFGPIVLLDLQPFPDLVVLSVCAVDGTDEDGKRRAQTCYGDERLPIEAQDLALFGAWHCAGLFALWHFVDTSTSAVSARYSTTTR